MENDLAMYKRWYYEKVETVNKRDKSISRLRGQITKLKKKRLAALRCRIGKLELLTTVTVAQNCLLCGRGG